MLTQIYDWLGVVEIRQSTKLVYQMYKNLADGEMVKCTLFLEINSQ